MTSNDPNFPEEIPSIPEPQNDLDESPTGEVSDDRLGKGSASWDSEQWTDATDSGNPEDIAPAQGSAVPADESFNGSDVDYDDALEDSNEESTTPNQGITVAETLDKPEPLIRESGADDDGQREAEKPAATDGNYDDWGQTEVPYQPKELGIIDQLLLLLADGAAVWRKGLRWVRSQLPLTWQRRLSDEVMTAIALGLLVLFLALWNPLGGSQAPQPVAETPTSPVEKTQEPAPNIPVPDSETPELAPAPGISSLPDTTPEQSLIADIQDKVSDISRAFAAGLIQSVEVNLPENRLIVNLGENWYGLLDNQQDEVSQSIFEQVQQLDFKTLQLRDPDGVIVARNPVVGHNMVILHRNRSTEAELSIS